MFKAASLEFTSKRVRSVQQQWVSVPGIQLVVPASAGRSVRNGHPTTHPARNALKLSESTGNISPQCRGRSRREPTLGPPHSRRSTGCVVLRVDLRVVYFFWVRERAPTLNSMQLEKSTSHGGVHRQISAGDEGVHRQALTPVARVERGARDHHHLFVVPWRRPRGQVPMLEAP